MNAEREKEVERQPTADAIMSDLVRACREQFDKYEKLYFKYGVVTCKQDINAEGQRECKEAGDVLSVKALAVGRHCVLNVSSLSLKSLHHAADAIESAKFERDFTSDPCKDLKFTHRQVSGTCNLIY